MWGPQGHILEKGRCKYLEKLEFKCSLNLLHLQNVLFDLYNYNFNDSEIYRLLNELSSYVSAKILKDVPIDSFTYEDIVLLTLKKIK